jgi:hypothetical protein
MTLFEDDLDALSDRAGRSHFLNLLRIQRGLALPQR